VTDHEEVEQTAKIKAMPGINWVHYRAQVGELVATFRLHKGSDEEDLLCEKFPQIKRYVDSGDDVAEADESKVVASYYKGGDYSLPEVIETFGWLNNLLRETSTTAERESCDKNPQYSHLEFHGVEIFRKKNDSE